MKVYGDFNERMAGSRKRRSRKEQLPDTVKEAHEMPWDMKKSRKLDEKPEGWGCACTKMV